MTTVVRHSRYGTSEALEFSSEPTPSPEAGQVVVAVGATSVNPLDWHMLTGIPLLTRLQGGFRTPKHARRGVDLAGVVVDVGPDVDDIEVGDRVVGSTRGAWAEQVLASADDLLHLPDAVTMEEAGGVAIAAATAIQSLRTHGRIREGDRVLIIGASGGVGTFAIQIARHLGAEVTAVCSERNGSLVTELGATEVIAYDRTDVFASGRRFDLVVDLVGHHPFRALRRLVAPGGRYVMASGTKRTVVGPLFSVAAMMAGRVVTRREATFFIAELNRADLDDVVGWMAEGAVRTVIDSVHPLDEVRQAVDRLATSRARGKIIVIPADRE